MAVVDWLKPVIGDLFEDVLTIIRDRDDNIAQMNFDADSNVPTGYIRSNTVNDDKLERFDGVIYEPLAFHDIIDAHIADGAIHAVTAPGTIAMYAGGSVPSGWAFCRGQALSRTAVGNGLELFNNIGIAYGAGDGLTTFNVPDFRRRMPIGKADSGDVSNLGDSGGDFNHTHGLPDHQHPIPDHRHGLNNHTHDLPAHRHNIPGHVHPIPPHNHSVSASGADIRITDGGAHTHDFRIFQSRSAAGTQRVNPNQSGDPLRTTESATHSHPNNEFAGRVGNVTGTGAVSGDSQFNSLNSADFNSDLNTSGLVSDGPNTSLSEFISGGSQPTDLAGSANPSDPANPPYLTVNFIIKL